MINKMGECFFLCLRSVSKNLLNILFEGLELGSGHECDSSHVFMIDRIAAQLIVCTFSFKVKNKNNILV